jgi:hypothetical protein
MTLAANRNDLGKRAGWIALLTAATFLGSFVFACATPFAALGAVAALNMRKRDAFALTGVNWLVNQIVGFGFLHYPQTWDTFAWGAAIGVAAVIATAAAIGAVSLMRALPWAVAAMATLAVACGVYELSLYAATAVLPTEADAFSAQTVLYVVEVSGVAFAGLLILQGIGQAIGLAAPKPQTAASPA